MKMLSHKYLLTRLIASVALCVPLVSGFSATSYGESPLVETDDNGAIDWQGAFVEATGQGTARYMGNKVQEELMAKQAARTTALARLLALTEGVRVTGLTTLGEHTQGDTRAATRIKGTVRGAKTISETITWHKDDSSRRGEVPFAEVTLRLCIDPSCSVSETKISHMTVSDTTPMSKPTKVAKDEQISAIIIDLEKALFLPALSPEIIDEQENLLYGEAMVDQHVMRDKGLVHYTKSVQSAKDHNVAGPNPLIISALKISPDNRIILSEKDADMIKDNPALKLAKVIVALD